MAAPAAALQSWPLATPRATGIHDVAPAPDGGVWFTAQRSGHLGWFDPRSARVELIALGRGSAPHGVIAGPDGAAWLTDGGQQAIVRVGWPQRDLRVYPLPDGTPDANLNTCAFDGDGTLWFTGQSGIIGRLEPRSGRIEVRDAPRGRGPYGIATTPDGDVYYASLAGSHIARVDLDTGAATVIEPPTKDQGARRVWSDSKGRIWVSEWNAGNVSCYDPRAVTWKTWKLPGEQPHAYAVYVDDRDKVWLSDWGANAMVRFDPETEKFEVLPSDRRGANVRQILGRPGEVWAPESGADRLVV